MEIDNHIKVSKDFQEILVVQPATGNCGMEIVLGRILLEKVKEGGEKEEAKKEGVC